MPALESSDQHRLIIREAVPGDGAGCNIHAVDPELGQEPDEDGLAEWFEQQLAEDRPRKALWLVAEFGGRIVGYVHGVVELPRADSRWQIQADLAHPRLIIGVLAVLATSRRSGIGTALMTAIEEAGQKLGARVAILDTNLRSDLSVPFYEERMAYSRRAVIFRKALPAAPGE